MLYLDGKRAEFSKVFQGLLRNCGRCLKMTADKSIKFYVQFNVGTSNTIKCAEPWSMRKDVNLRMYVDILDQNNGEKIHKSAKISRSYQLKVK
jgi:hypothetical protein